MVEAIYLHYLSQMPDDLSEKQQETAARKLAENTIRKTGDAFQEMIEAQGLTFDKPETVKQLFRFTLFCSLKDLIIAQHDEQKSRVIH